MIDDEYHHQEDTAEPDEQAHTMQKESPNVAVKLSAVVILFICSITLYILYGSEHQNTFFEGVINLND